jgi:Flp pilus assembly protein TadG
MIKSTKKLTWIKNEHAQTMVEFALVFPVVLLITYGIIEFGRMLFIYAAVTGSAREGARYGLAAGVGANGIVQYADCQGIRDAVRKTAFLISIPDSNINIQYDNGSTIKSSCPPSTDPKDSNRIKLGDRIIVTVTARYDPVIGSFLGIGGDDITQKNYRTILLNVIAQ